MQEGGGNRSTSWTSRRARWSTSHYLCPEACAENKLAIVHQKAEHRFSSPPEILENLLGGLKDSPGDKQKGKGGKHTGERHGLSGLPHDRRPSSRSRGRLGCPRGATRSVPQESDHPPPRASARREHPPRSLSRSHSCKEAKVPANLAELRRKPATTRSRRSATKKPAQPARSRCRRWWNRKRGRREGLSSESHEVGPPTFELGEWLQRNVGPDIGHRHLHPRPTSPATCRAIASPPTCPWRRPRKPSTLYVRRSAPACAALPSGDALT